jgi:UDP-N-acetylmuramate: L-alanyl-gamma-D-glutamyl-meso-diaminopimelate ligase
VYDDFAHHPDAPSRPRSRACAPRAARAHRGGDGAAQQLDAPGRACRCAGAFAAMRDIVVFLHRPELAWDAGKVVGACAATA